MNIYSVYWIRHTNHKDPYLEGYIGLTNNYERRIKEHFSIKYDNILTKAIKKYNNDLVHEILYCDLSEDEAKKIEKKYRPKMRIGWNIMSGGNIPPNNKGKKRPDMSKRMIGKNNPFYGKKHSDEYKRKVSIRMSGEKNPFYGKKRPKHSEKMKKKIGKDYPKFKGYFITPLGKFDSFQDASSKLGINPNSLYAYCIQKNNEKIKSLSYSKSAFLKNFDSKENVVGKTYKEIGFGFEYV